MLEVTKIRDNVDLCILNGKEIYIVGTAHVSQSSVELAESVIREINPEVVAIELCEPRLRSLEDPDRWKNTDIITVVREGRTNVLLAQLVLSAFQRKIGEKLKITPGAEMLNSARVGRELGARIAVIDRSVSTTMKRVWRGLGIIGAGKLIWNLIFLAISNEEVTKEEIERLKSSDVLEDALREFTQKFPEVREALIDERDKFLSGSLQKESAKKIVAVVGAAHVPGMLKYLDTEIDLDALNTIPKPSLKSKILGWSFPALLIGAFIYSLFAMGTGKSTELAWTWFWITGLWAAIGAAVSLSHPITIVLTFLSAPFAILHPLIASGWIAGLSEAYLRKPRVSDFDTIASDITSVRGLFRNRVTKILLIVAIVNLAAMAGAAIGTGTAISRVYE